MAEKFAEGHEAVRGEDGRFISTSLDPERASMMGKRSAHKRWSKDSRVQELLLEEGYRDDEDNPPPAHIVTLAEFAVANYAALQHWRKIHGRDEAGGSGSAFERVNDHTVRVEGKTYFMGAHDRGVRVEDRSPDALRAIAGMVLQLAEESERASAQARL